MTPSVHGHHLAFPTGAEDGKIGVCVADLSNNAPGDVFELPGTHKTLTQDTQTWPDGQSKCHLRTMLSRTHVAVSTATEPVMVWDRSTSQLVRVLDVKGPHSDNPVCLSLREHYLVTCRPDTFRVFDLLAPHSDSQLPLHPHLVRGVGPDQPGWLHVVGDTLLHFRRDRRRSAAGSEHSSEQCFYSSCAKYDVLTGKALGPEVIFSEPITGKELSLALRLDQVGGSEALVWDSGVNTSNGKNRGLQDASVLNLRTGVLRRHVCINLPEERKFLRLSANGKCLLAPRANRQAAVYWFK